jgi:DNA polymerase III alpha subunit
MGKLFHDIPESLDNTQEIVDKVDVLETEKGHPAAKLRYPARV